MLRKIFIPLCIVLISSVSITHAMIGDVNHFLSAKDYEQQVESLEEQLTKDKANPDLLTSLAEAYWELGEYKKAQKWLEEAVDVRDTRAEDYFLLGRIYSNRVREVSVFKKLSYAGRIRKSFERAVELNPHHVKAHLALILFYLNAPGIAGGGEDKANAVVTRLKDISTIAEWRGQILIAMSQGEMESALHYVDKILIEQPHDVDTLFTRSILLINDENYESAANSLEQLIQLKIENRDDRQRQHMAWYQMGKLASESGQWLEHGKDYLEAFLKLDLQRGLPPKSWAYYRLALIHEHLNEPTRTKSLLLMAENENDGEDDELESLVEAALKNYKD